MKTIHVEVTQEDIDNGWPGRVDACAIALAVRRAAGCSCAIGGSESNSLYPGNGLIASFAIPQIATRFVWDFDKNLPVHPFAFDIEVDL